MGRIHALGHDPGSSRAAIFNGSHWEALAFYGCAILCHLMLYVLFDMGPWNLKKALFLGSRMADLVSHGLQDLYIQATIYRISSHMVPLPNLPFLHPYSIHSPEATSQPSSHIPGDDVYSLCQLPTMVGSTNTGPMPVWAQCWHSLP